MKLLVLAGGFGSRLRSVVPEYPKALAPINGIPFLQLQLKNWYDQGIRDFIFLLHYQAEEIISFLECQKKHHFNDCEFSWVVENFPADTGGAVANAVKQLGLQESFFVANADTWLGSGVAELLSITQPALAVVQARDMSRYGQILFDESMRITHIAEKNSILEGGWINAGFYRLDAGSFKDWNGLRFSLEKDLFPELVGKRELTVVLLKTDFIDIGIPEDYYRFCAWQKSASKNLLCN
jgi:D-glycero-alpha-D-manno-heptose 1-phosphate guanylyltransferase